MKKIWRRTLLIAAMLVLVFSVHAIADQKLYSARTITFPNQYGGGWSNQFTLPVKSNVTIGISITGNNQSTYINQGLQYVLQNISSGQKVYLTVPAASQNKLNYSIGAAMNPGTYSFGVYYKGGQAFKLRFSIYAVGGLNVPDSLEVMKDTTETVVVKPSDGSTNFIKVKSVKSSAPGYATATYDNSKTPPTVTVKGVAIGNAVITVYGVDGSYDTMNVKVTKYVPAPTLNHKSLSMSAGNVVYNAVENATSTVTWSSSNSKVAKVGQNGRIKAIGFGKCVIRAKTVSNGKTYDLACTVKVSRTAPNYKAKLIKYNASKKLMKVRVENLTNVPMVFYSKNAYVMDIESGKKLRSAQLKNGSSITIGKKKTKTFYLKVKGKKLADSTCVIYGVKLLFKQDKRNYYASIFKDIDVGGYCWKSDPKKYFSSYLK